MSKLKVQSKDQKLKEAIDVLTFDIHLIFGL
jgi:hypothetical protein